MFAPRPKRARVRNAALAALSGLASVVGCNSNVQEQIALAQLAQTCLVNSDCKTPLVCAFESCHAECETSRDCQDGARCVAAARPFKVCQLEEERLCEHTADCAEGLVCGVDGECRDQCVADSECVEGQRCVSGTCADLEELDDSGELPVAQGMDRGSEGSPCVYVSDCSAALLCRDRSCLAECKADRDCAVGQICQETRCVPDGMQPLACDYSSDCDTERGERCLGGGCYCMCAEDRDCPKNQLCNGCGCEPDPSAPKGCTYNSDCDSPGEICRNRECACECRADADCSGNLRCDGCGCFDPRLPVDGIVRGDVTVESSLQLPQYRGVTEILGDLYITDNTLTDLGDIFDDLRVVQGRIVVNGNGKLTQLSFPKLEKTTWFSIGNLTNITSIDLPSLKSTYFDWGSLEKVETVNLDAFESGGIQAYGLPKLARLNLPSATSLNGLYLNDFYALEELLMPELTELTGSVSLAGNNQMALRVLSAPKLALIEGPYVAIQNTALTTLDDFGTTALTVSLFDLQITGNTQLSDCEIAELVTRFKAGGLTSTPTISSNLPCPDCQGPNCPS